LVSTEDIVRRVRELGQQISVDYQGKHPVLIGVLTGSFVFFADLLRALTIPVRCDFVKISSYGNGTTSTGTVLLQLDLSIALAGQDVLVVEDIVDTGTSSAWLLEHLRRKRPASLRLCALLDKPSRRQTPMTIDYLGFSIPDRFVVGYGIDYAENYRQLPYIGYLPEQEGSNDSKSQGG
jgi:hypoxanthine phosphoribosyltransferase